MLPRIDAKCINFMMAGENDRRNYEPIMIQLLEAEIPMLEGLVGMPLDEPNAGQQMEIAKQLLGDLPVGMTHFILHPSIDTADLRSIAPNGESRVANYKVFMSDELKKFIESEDIKPIGYRQIRDAVRAG